jgi:glucans biosynthesis protein C
VTSSRPIEANSERLFFLDWLRILAFAVLVAYHVGMYYVRWDFHVKSPFASSALEPWMMLTAPWRMDLIFMVSGAATALMLKNGFSFALLSRRTRFLWLPLLFGMAVIVPPQSYLEVVQKYGFEGDYFKFLGIYFSGYKGFCQNGKCLILPTWNHLWFLAYLWLYTLVLWIALRARPSALNTASNILNRLSRSPMLLVAPFLVIVCIRFALYARFPSNHAVLGDWFNHAMYFGMFLLGASFANRPALWPVFLKWRWPAFVLAIGCWAVLVGVRPGRPGEHLIIAAMQWGAIIAAFGFAQSLLNRDHPLRAAGPLRPLFGLRSQSKND